MRIHFQFFASLLDTLNIGACLYDEADRAVLWNRSFFRFFPEHAGHIHEGEPYRENLLRFYRGRLSGAALDDIERYVTDGIARHHQQTRPYSFEHRGMWLRVSSLKMPKIGRLRVWLQVPAPKVEMEAFFEKPVDSMPAADRADIGFLESMADGISILGQDNRVRSVNEHFLLLFGLPSRDVVIGQTMAALYQQAWQSFDAGALAAEELRQKVDTLEENLRFTGAPFEVALPGNRWIRMNVERNREGVSYCIHTDISELKRRQQELERAELRTRESEARYRLLADHLTDVVVALDAARYVRYVSPSIRGMLGVAPQDLIGLAWQDVVTVESGAQFDGWSSEEQLPVAARHTFLTRRRDGSPLWLEQDVSVLQHQASDQAIEYIFHLRDVSARKEVELALERANAELAAQALTDGLSGLGNRRHFDQTLTREWLRMRRERDALALLMIDIDYFKILNDQHGHQAGDECIRRLATAIRGAARRPGDFAARYGGEEFVLLLPHTDRQEAMRIAEQLQLAVRSLPVHAAGEQAGVMSVSIGVASVEPDAGSTNADALLSAADLALYKAKRNGRNRCEHAD
jgi:diguanylate cyclase (GGDEF)-like protein/PAS domain S-box-containing protein